MTADLRQIIEGVLLVFAALFPIVNPLGGAPIFLAMTSDYTPEERASLAWRVTVNAIGVLRLVGAGGPSRRGTGG
jgi:multiple antibiotic resistance protein